MVKLVYDRLCSSVYIWCDMVPSSHLADEGAGQGQLSGRVQFEDLPVETVIETISHLDFDGLDNMLRVSRRLRRIIEAYWSSVLPGILDREFSPVGDFFEALRDIALPVQDRKSWDDSPVKEDLCSPDHRLPNFVTGGAPWLPSTKRLHLILAFCRTIKLWEMEFQRQRFFHYPDCSRSLRPQELSRLRQGLYAWWRFARNFHGGAQFEHNSQPIAHTTRLPSIGLEQERRFMWQFSTAQLHNILDMWETVRSAVGREVCPSVGVVSEWLGHTLSTAEAARMSWGDGIENEHILSTIMKLRPEDILHLLMYRHRYTTRRSVIDFVKLRNPRIEESMETFRDAIIDVLIERDSEHIPGGNFFQLSGFPDPDGGIIDHEAAGREELRAMLSQAPVGAPQHTPWERYVDSDMAMELPPGRLVPSL